MLSTFFFSSFFFPPPFQSFSWVLLVSRKNNYHLGTSAGLLGCIMQSTLVSLTSLRLACVKSPILKYSVWLLRLVIFEK